MYATDVRQKHCLMRPLYGAEAHNDKRILGRQQTNNESHGFNSRVGNDFLSQN